MDGGTEVMLDLMAAPQTRSIVFLMVISCLSPELHVDDSLTMKNGGKRGGGISMRSSLRFSTDVAVGDPF